MRFGNQESSVPFREQLAMVNFKADSYLLEEDQRPKWENVKADYLVEADLMIERGEESAKDVMQDGLHQIAHKLGITPTEGEIIPWQIVYLVKRPLTPAEEDWALELEKQLKAEGKL